MNTLTANGPIALRLAVLACLLIASISDARARPIPAPDARAGSDARVADIIRESGDALHVEALRSIRVIHATGNIVADGLSGRGDDWDEIGGMRETSRFSTPPLRGGSGWDGKESWTLDQTGLVIIDGSILGRSSAINQAYFDNYDLWTPGYGGATVAWKGSKSEKGKRYDVLTVTPPKSSLPIDVWFARATHLPVKVVQTAGPMVTTTILADFEPVEGLMMPYRIDTSTNSGSMTSFRASHVEANPSRGAAQLVTPKSSPHDFSIDGGATEASVPVRISENHVYLDVMLNGKGPFRFVLDTGGANVIDSKIATALGLASSGSTRITGVGSASAASSFAVIRTLRIEAARINNQIFVVLPISKTVGRAHGIPMDGVIGYEVLSRFVTTFDYANRRIVLHMPGSYRPPPEATVVPIVQYGTQPQFACSIDNVPTTCTLDTGAHESLSFFTPFIGRLGRVRALSFGGLTLRDLVGDFAAQRAGGLAMPFIGANVGGAVWKRFTMTLDYRELTMTLTPNANFDMRDHWDRSGVYLLNNGAITILDVRPGTPAAKAGLTKGDVITSVDGSPSLSLNQVRSVFLGKPGALVHLIVKRKDGATHAIDLVLADYV